MKNIDNNQEEAYSIEVKEEKGVKTDENLKDWLSILPMKSKHITHDS